MMTIALPAELEELVNARIRSGRFNSSGEVIRAGLQLLHEQETLRQIKLEQLRSDIAVGLRAEERGELISSEDVFRELYQRNQDAAGKK